MYSGSEDGTVKIWDMRAPGFQREYASRGAVNTVVLHPNQGELISGEMLTCTATASHATAEEVSTPQLANHYSSKHLACHPFTDCSAHLFM